MPTQFLSAGGPLTTAFSQVYDTTGVLNGQTGVWRELQATDFGASYLAAISGQGSTYSAVSNSTVSGSMSAFTTGLALPSTSTRKEAYIQVVGSGSPLYLAFNTTVASQSNFNVILKAATSDFGTDGGVWTSDRYTGPVSVSGFIGCRFSAWQNAN